VSFVILNLVNPDFIIIMYHLELTPNTYEIIINCVLFIIHFILSYTSSLFLIIIVTSKCQMDGFSSLCIKHVIHCSLVEGSLSTQMFLSC
jgi:hypothetical protein